MIWIGIFVYIIIGIIIISIGIKNKYLDKAYEFLDFVGISVEIILWPVFGLGLLTQYISDKLL